MSGFICVSIDKAIKQIVNDIGNAKRCEKELKPLKDQVTSMEALIRPIQHYRLVISWKNGPTVENWVTKFNEWLKKLDKLLQEASGIAQQCTMSANQGILRDQMNKKIMDLTSNIEHLISNIEQHLKSMSSWVENPRSEGIVDNGRYITPGWEAVTATSHLTSVGQSGRDILRPSTNSENISQAARIDTLATARMKPMDEQDKVPTYLDTPATARMKLVDEPFIVGQDKALTELENFVIADDAKPIDVVGKGGSGKTLLLKRLFNSKKVRKRFKKGLLLWLTVSQNPSLDSLINQLWTQIAIQTNVDVVKNIKDQHVEIWIAVQNNVDVMQNGKQQQVEGWLSEQRVQNTRFVLFLDDVRDKDAEKLSKELSILQAVGKNSNWKVIVSSRDEGVLSKMGIKDSHTIKIMGLNEHASWKLFCSHAFPYNNRNPPAKEEGKLLCHLCQGLPLAIKVVGRAMAGYIHPKQWRWALQRLSNTKSVYDCRLRFSLEALGNEGVNMQCCFLLVAAASSEDEVLFARHVIELWAGEGLLSGKMVQEDSYDPFEMGWSYLNLLADRFLIEPLMRYYDGRVVCFRIHDELRNLAIQIAKEEENFRLDLNGNGCSGWTRIFLRQKELSSVHQSIRNQCCSLFMPENRDFTKIPKEVIGSMTFLKFLDLSRTAVESLPKSLGSLKQLVCIKLLGVPIKRLPASFTTLVNLEILDLSFSSITELPSEFHMLKSLRYLGLTQCKDLQYLPRSISQLTSLQYLHLIDCNSLWTNAEWHKRKKAAQIADLKSLIKLKRLELQNNGETIAEETLEKMTQLDTLRLTLTKKKNLPRDIGKVPELKRLALRCSDLAEVKFFEPENKKEIEFQSLFSNLSYLVLFKCDMLVKLPNLHGLKSLQRLEIIACRKLKELPKEFGDTGAFPKLEIFSLVRLEKLEKLPEIKEGAMPALQIFTIMECPALEIPKSYKSYLKLKTLKKLRIYGCSTTVENSEGDKEAHMDKNSEGDKEAHRDKNSEGDKEADRDKNSEGDKEADRDNNSEGDTEGDEEADRDNNSEGDKEADRDKVKLVTLSIRNTEEIKNRYFQLCVKHGSWIYNEHWCNELFLFLGGLDSFV